MAGLKIISTLALLSAVSAGHLGHFQPAAGYTAFGTNAYSSAAVAASASAYQQSRSYGSYGAHIPILSYENVNNGDGNYRYSYETGNGISAHENGAPRAPGPEGPAVTAEGGFSYRAPDGQQVSLTYTADENGFHPVGSHIPTPPPIPEAILRSIQLNRQHPSSGDGSYNGHFNNGHFNNGYHY
uniref:Pupal cuticle protein 20-like n=1 Tax=Heliothis virescens TaxID=7102 RepID=A0A2A4ITA3_HELVI